MTKKPADLRETYMLGKLRRSDLRNDPMEQFRLWFNQAVEADLPEPNAMTLSTADKSGRPSSRIVLLKDITDEGFSFYTNYNSRKALEIEQNPYVSLLFLWLGLERQVRIEGFATRTGHEEADRYFRLRPEGSRLGAWVSEQSKVIASRADLDARMEMFSKQFADGEIPRPDHWGGYVVKPSAFEFWQGRENRLHDRFLYTSENGVWRIDRLSP